MVSLVCLDQPHDLDSRGGIVSFEAPRVMAFAPILQTLGLSPLPSAPVLMEALATSPGFLCSHSQPSSSLSGDVIFCSLQSSSVQALSRGCTVTAILLTGFPASGTSSACIQMSFLKGKMGPLHSLLFTFILSKVLCI